MFNKKFMYIIICCGVLVTPTAGKLYNLISLTDNTIVIHWAAVVALFLIILFVTCNAWKTMANTNEANPHFTYFRFIGGMGAIAGEAVCLQSIYTNPIDILYGAMFGAVALYVVVVVVYVGLVPSAHDKK